MFKHSKLHRILAGTVLLAALPLAAQAQGKEPVKIALVTSKSGGFSTMGVDVASGIKFAVEEANAKGGVDGRQIVVAEGDDESTPDAGRRVAEKLAREGHNLIIGPITSGISLAISQNLARWDAAFIGTMSKADKLTQDACNPRFARRSAITQVLRAALPVSRGGTAFGPLLEQPGPARTKLLSRLGFLVRSFHSSHRHGVSWRCCPGCDVV